MAAAQVHLPEAVLGRYVALGEERVRNRLGADVGNAARVAQDLNPRGEPRDLNRSIEAGKARATALVEPRRAPHDHEQEEAKNQKGETLEESFHVSWRCRQFLVEESAQE
jgi:hypothetical protein